jgi:hypothetical protein
MLRWKSSLKPAAAAPSGDNPGTTNLKGWWSLDDSSGNFSDSHTSSTPLTASGTPTYSQTGVVSTAIDFDGSSDYGSATADVISGYPFSASGWFKTTTTTQGTMFYFGRFDAGNTYHILWINSSGQAQLTSRYFSQVHSTSTSTYNDGNWHHIAGVWHSATERRLYIDGSEVAGGTGLTSLSFISSTANGVAIGRSNDDTPAVYFDGTLDEWCFFDDALTADEITWLYNSGSGRSYSDISGGATGITLEDSAENEGFTGYSSPYDFSVSYPAVSTNDIMLAILTTERRVDFDGTPPAGWTKVIETDGDNSYNPTQAVYWYRATGSASASTGNTWSSIVNGAQQYYAWVGAYSGCVTSGSPIDASAGSFISYNTNWSQSITTQSNNAMILAVAGSDNNARTFVWSDGTELVDKIYQSTASVTINEKIESTAGATTRSGTISAAVSGTMTAVALKPPSAPSYLLEENFEGTGTPTGFSVTSGTIDFDATPPSSSPNGGECIKITQRNNVVEYSISTSSALYLYFQFYVDSTGFAATEIVKFETGVNSRAAALSLNADATDNLELRSGYNSEDAPANDYSADTWYHCWIYYNPATGEQNLEFNTTGTRSGSGDGYVSRTISTTSNSINKLRIEGRRNANTYIDRVLISESVIGDNP